MPIIQNMRKHLKIYYCPEELDTSDGKIEQGWNLVYLFGTYSCPILISYEFPDSPLLILPHKGKMDKKFWFTSQPMMLDLAKAKSTSVSQNSKLGRSGSSSDQKIYDLFRDLNQFSMIRLWILESFSKHQYFINFWNFLKFTAKLETIQKSWSE